MRLAAGECPAAAGVGEAGRRREGAARPGVAADGGAESLSALGCRRACVAVGDDVDRVLRNAGRGELGPASPQDVTAILDRLERAVADGELDRGRVDTSVRRLLELKARLGLLD